MTVVLRIEASARATRSLTRRMTQLFLDEWRRRLPDVEVINRDVGLHPPPFVTETWIAACFTPPADRTDEMRAALAPSDELIAELRRADVLLIGSPMYNYGMPAALKAWFDQVCRVDETFTFDLARGDDPIEPIFSGKTMVVLSSRGEFGFQPGGMRERLNHLDPHLRTCGRFLGFAEDHLVATEYQEFRDDRHEESVARGNAEIVELVARLTDSAARGDAVRS
ncbi:MAG: FMN-dependent NADH-azoreductase [Planctomycetia bacterium]